MTNLMQKGAAWLGERLKAVAGRTVTVEQEHRTWTNVVGSVMKSTLEVVSTEGFLHRVSADDWTFSTADLPGLRQDLPASVIETVDGVTTTWESFPIPGGEDKDDLDTSSILLVIHTKKVASNV